MKNIKFLIVVMLSVTVSMYSSSYAHAIIKQDNEQLKEPQKTVRIVVEQSYKDGNNRVEGINLPFESTTHLYGLFCQEKRLHLFAKKSFFDKGLTPVPAPNVFCLHDPTPQTTACADLLF